MHVDSMDGWMEGNKNANKLYCNRLRRKVLLNQYDILCTYLAANDYIIMIFIQQGIRPAENPFYFQCAKRRRDMLKLLRTCRVKFILLGLAFGTPRAIVSAILSIKYTILIGLRVIPLFTALRRSCGYYSIGWNLLPRHLLPTVNTYTR